MERWSAEVAMAGGATGGPARKPGGGNGGEGGYLYRQTEVVNDPNATVDDGSNGQMRIKNPNLPNGESAAEIWEKRNSPGGWTGSYDHMGDAGVAGAIAATHGGNPTPPAGNFPIIGEYQLGKYAGAYLQAGGIFPNPVIPVPGQNINTGNSYHVYDPQQIGANRMSIAPTYINPNLSF